MKRAVALFLCLVTLVGCSPDMYVDVNPEESESILVKHPYITEFTLPFNEWYPTSEKRGEFTFYRSENNPDVFYTTWPLPNKDIEVPTFRHSKEVNVEYLQERLSTYADDRFFSDFSTSDTVIDLEEWVSDEEAHGVYLDYSVGLARYTYNVYARDTTIEEATKFINHVTNLGLDHKVFEQMVRFANGSSVYCYLSDSIIAVLKQGGVSLTWYVADYSEISFITTSTGGYEKLVTPNEDGTVVKVKKMSGEPASYIYNVSEYTEQQAMSLAAAIGYEMTSEVFDESIQLYAATKRGHLAVAFHDGGSSMMYYTANVDCDEIAEVLKNVYGFNIDPKDISMAVSYALKQDVQVTMFEGDWNLSFAVEYMYDYPILDVYAAYSKDS